MYIVNNVIDVIATRVNGLFNYRPSDVFTVMGCC